MATRTAQRWISEDNHHAMLATNLDVISIDKPCVDSGVGGTSYRTHGTLESDEWSEILRVFSWVSHDERSLTNNAPPPSITRWIWPFGTLYYAS